MQDMHETLIIIPPDVIFPTMKMGGILAERGRGKKRKKEEKKGGIPQYQTDSFSVIPPIHLRGSAQLHACISDITRRTECNKYHKGVKLSSQNEHS